MDQIGNVFSQFGEDRIIEKHLGRLSRNDLVDNWACEFGAWDGLHYSNVANLIINSNYSAVLIEPDFRKFNLLQRNMKQYQVTAINEFVTIEGSNSLDNQLKNTSIPNNFDLLSIDIDGADYWIFDSMSKYRPKIIVIEFNPTVPKEIEFVNPKNIKVNQGSSIRSISLLAESKNYKVIGSTACNLFLIDAKYSNLFADTIIEIQDLADPPFVNYIWQTYDGRVHTQATLTLLWHDIRFPNKSLQLLPRYLLKFPANMNRMQSLLLFIWKWAKKVTKLTE